MDVNFDIEFQQQRYLTFDKMSQILSENISNTPASLLSKPHETAEEPMQHNAKRESLSLFLQSIEHLKSGAPGNTMGSITEAASKASLRSSSLAISLGINPPRFEQNFFSVDYSNGYEQAMFLCDKLISAAEKDFLKSREIIHMYILNAEEKENIKKQMIFCFNILNKTYQKTCDEIKTELLSIAKT